MTRIYIEKEEKTGKVFISNGKTMITGFINFQIARKWVYENFDKVIILKKHQI